jgi:predicted nucleic acid-binding protein
MTAADAFYVALAEHLSANFLTDDHNLAGAPTFPRQLHVLRFARRPLG